MTLLYLITVAFFVIIIALILLFGFKIVRDQKSALKKFVEDTQAKFREKDKQISELDDAITNRNGRISDLEDLLEDFKSGLHITDEFLEVRELLKRGEKIIFVHGGAGTGKSTLIQWLSKHNMIQVRLAPTGLAALNIGGKTIHKFFGFAPVPVFHKSPCKIPDIPRNNKSILENIHTICIDEISMVRSDMIDAIDRALRTVGQEDQAFGGYQMLFVGDLYQLPPIVTSTGKLPAINFFKTKNNLCNLKTGWESEWFLDSEILKRNQPSIVHLTKVFRQTDRKFIDLLNEIRVRQNLEENVKTLNSCIKRQKTTPPNTVILTTKVQTAEEENKKKIAALPDPEVNFIADKQGVYKEYEDKDLPVPSEFCLKRKAFVMIVYNDPDNLFVNGTTGIIERLSKQSAEIRLKSGLTVTVFLHTWESYKTVWNKSKKEYENILEGLFTQMPLLPAYAITCHKAQGKTLDNVHIRFEGQAFASGQSYVALSRARKIENISAERYFNLGDFKPEMRLEYFQKNRMI